MAKCLSYIEEARCLKVKGTIQVGDVREHVAEGSICSERGKSSKGREKNA